MVNNERIAGRNKFAVYIIRPVICLIIAGLFISCHNLYSDSLESALNMAGENRKELEKVLDRYKSCPEDSLKYKAACFLIENMPYYSYHEGELLDNYLTYFKLLRENKKTTLSPDDISDSIVKKYGSYSIHALKQKKDIQEIDSAFLCHNIEWAFKVWQEQPWGKNVSFDHFCEYILPYRIDNEKPEYWREDLYNKYNHLLSSLRNSLSKEADDPISAVYLLMEHITKEDIYYTTTTPASLPHVGASVAQFRSGSCRELTDYAIYVCRALGIPCHIDFMPVRGDNNVGHFWISFQAKNGDLYMQEFPDAVWNVQKAGMKGSRKTKVYRYTFSVNRKMRNELASFDSSFPALFLNPKLIDVTYPYTKHYLSQLNIPSSRLYDKKKRGLVYLCTHQSFSWTPVAWGIIDRNGANFSDLQKGDVWRLAAREGDKLEFISDPFMVHPYSNQLTFYSSEQNSQ